MIGKIITWLSYRLIDWHEKRGTFIDIRGRYNPTLYLRRYPLFPKSAWWAVYNVYVHRFFRSDADVPHDHPWNFLTYVVKDGYTEDVWERTDAPIRHHRDYKKVSYNRLQGGWIFRKATHLHRVVLGREFAESDILKTPITVCFIGRRQREWGFMEKINTPKQTWTRWETFIEKARA